MHSDAMIRPATLSDATELATIYNAYVTGSTVTFDMTPWTASDMEHKIEVVAARSMPFLVVEVAGAVAGYGYLSTWRDKSAFDATVENTLYLKPEFQGQGLGGRLLDELMSAGRAAGAREVIAVISDTDDAAASIALHSARGFTPVGSMPDVGYKFDRWLGVVMLQKSLRP